MSELILCRCWDVTIADIEQVIHGGAPDIEWIKRHTGMSTGSCQGRWCLKQTLVWLRENYPEYDWSKLPTARQPLYPVPISALAGAPVEEEHEAK